MASDQVIIPWGVTGATLAVRLWNTDAEIWDFAAGTPAFVAYNAANFADYDSDISANEKGASGRYSFTMPSTVPSGLIHLEVILGSGAAELETPVYDRYIQWNGSVILSLAATAVNITVEDREISVE